MCIFIDTNISNDLDMPSENHCVILPLSCDENLEGGLNRKVVMDMSTNFVN